MKEKAPGGFLLPAPDPRGGELFLTLLRTCRELDVGTIRQVDAERVGVVLLQGTGGHVEDPLATAPAEGDVRNIGVSCFVHVIDRAPNRVNQSYRTVTGREHCRRVG